MNRISMWACGTIASLGLFGHQAIAHDDDRLRLPLLDGAWNVEFRVRVDAADCTTAAIVGIGPNPFPALVTFHRGGTLSEFGTRSPSSVRSPGHGIWKRTGYRTFEYRAMFFQFDVNGLLNQTMDMRSNVTLAWQGDTFDGWSRLVLTDVSGNVRRFCATLRGERMTL